MRDSGWPADRIDTNSAHSARIYDYMIGGKDHYPADKEVGDAMARDWPAARTSMRASRSFMHRAVRQLAQDAGIRQFLDIGTGIPTSPNLHEIAQAVAPQSRVVYVDNDPIVLTLSQGLLASSPEGRTAYIEADVRKPDDVLDAPELRDNLDLSQPVALTLLGLLHYLEDKDDPYGLVNRLLEPLPSGSYLAISLGTTDIVPEGVEQTVSRAYAGYNIPTRPRTMAETERFFDGLELVDPGIVQVHKWRPDAASAQIRDQDIAAYGAVARKP